MGVSYDKVTTEDPQLNQVQGKIAEAFSKVPDPVPEADGIVRIETASGNQQYKCKDSDRYVVGITSAFPLLVSLGAVSPKRTVLVICSGPKPVTVQRSDGRAMAGIQSRVLEQYQASLFVADGKDWQSPV